YPTAAALADDLAHYLRGEPILARPVGRVERAVRWCNRNRMVAGLMGLAVLLLVGGMAVSTTLAIYANYQKADAVQQKGIADANNRKAQENARKWREQERLATKNAVLATTAAEQAKKSAIAATESAAFARKNQYFADVNLAQQVLAAGDVAQAIDLLDNHIPAEGHEDLRGFEWYYLWSLAHSSAAGILWDQEKAGAVREVRSAKVSPDGTMLAVAGGRSNQGEVILYDARTREPLRTLPLQKACVTAVAWSSDSARLAICSGQLNGTSEVKLFSAATGEVLWEVASPDPPLALALSADGKWLAVGTAKLIQGHGSPPDRFFSTAVGAREGGARILSASDGSVVGELPGDVGNVFSLAFSPDGETLAVGNERGEVLLYNAPAREKTGEFHSGLRYVWSLTFSSKGEWLAAAAGFWNEPGEVSLWNTKSRQVERRVLGHRGGTTTVTFGPGDQILATGSFDRTVRLWSVRDGRELTVFYGHRGYVWDVAFSDGGKTLLAGAWRQNGPGEVLAWQVAEGLRFTPLPAGIFSGGGYYWSVAAGGTVIFPTKEGFDIWDANSATRRASVTKKGLRCIDVSPNGRLVAGGGFAEKTGLWNADNGQLIAELPTLTIPYLSFSPDGALLATCGDDGVLRLWKAATGKPLQALTGHTDVVWSVAFTPDSQRLATASWDGTVRLWEPMTGRALGAFPGHTEALWQVAFLENGRTLVSRSGSQEQNIGVWDVSRVLPQAESEVLPPPTSREVMEVYSYALLAAARSQAGEAERAQQALDHMVERAARHLSQLPLIAVYAEGELENLQEIINALLRLQCWREVDKLCRLSEAACARQLAVAPDSAGLQAIQALVQIKGSQAAVGFGQPLEALPRLRAARQTLLKLIADNPKATSLQGLLAQAENGFAWYVAMQPEVPRDLIDEAVLFARACTARRPAEGIYMNTLGVILLRAELWDEAVAVLQKSCELRSGGDANDWYPLAVAFHRQGKAEEAKMWFDRAEAWLKVNPSNDADLPQLRKEAAALILPPRIQE
ncbi:MAG TPA: hypothetical protein VFV87_00005, partial [Pirellulaceae bacterium]|nr:hypothetical protein [Pirellulaceae bacterium]